VRTSNPTTVMIIIVVGVVIMVFFSGKNLLLDVAYVKIERYNSDFHAGTVLAIVHLQTVLHTEFVGMFMICLHTRFHMYKLKI
jgi:hypothetical protein